MILDKIKFTLKVLMLLIEDMILNNNYKQKLRNKWKKKG